MGAFQELLREKRIDVGYLTTHVFPLERATDAYDLLIEKTKPFIGILIEYDLGKGAGIVPHPVALRRPNDGGKPATVGIGFIGAGSYAQSSLLPNIPREDGVEFRGVVTATGTGARSVGGRFRFEFCSCDASDILDNERINTAFIATRHDSHGEYVLRALKAGKHVFVEKPLCTSGEALAAIATAYEEARTPDGSRPLVMVGFNRRFSPLAMRFRESVGTGPMAMVYRVNAGHVPPESWVHDPQAGGRIVGEACHFIDFMTWANGSLPVLVHAAAMPAGQGVADTVTMSLTFGNGSVGTLAYFANGDKSLPKERIEVFAGGVSVVIDDFRSIAIHAGGKRTGKSLSAQDKGQKEQVRRFVDAIRAGGADPIPFTEIYSATLTTFRALESLRTGNSVRLHE
jgi:polar amino acid transport system substrate-binding protein